MDSVEGKKGGAVLLTIHFVKAELMLAFYREYNDSRSVTNIFNDLYRRLGKDDFKKIFPLFAALLMVSAVWAQEEQAPVQKLNVHMMDGQVVTFLLDKEPVTKFEPGKLILQTSGDAPIMYLLENVRKYTYEGLPEGIDAPIVAPGTIMVRQGKDMVAIDGLPDKANVAIYAADGKLLISRQAVGGQTTVLPMTAFPAGNYIINAGGASFKFVKQ